MKRRRSAASRNETSTVDEAQRRVEQNGDLDEDTKQHILAFMSYLQVEGLKPNTIAGYTTMLRRLASMCPGNEFLYLEREDVQEVILALQREGYRTSTMNLFRSRFLRFQRWLRQERGYPEDYPDFGVSGERLEPGEKPVEFRGIKTASRYALRYGPEDAQTAPHGSTGALCSCRVFPGQTSTLAAPPRAALTSAVAQRARNGGRPRVGFTW